MDNDDRAITIISADHCEIEQYPHVIKALTALWGTPDFIDYCASLICTERPNREGFSIGVVQDLTFLRELYVNNFKEVGVKTLTKKEFEHVKQVLEGDAWRGR